MEFVVFAALPIKKLLNKPNLNVVTRKKKHLTKIKKKVSNFSKKKFPAQFFLLLISILPSDSKKNPKHER
jgi:hypothetical protein